MKRCDCLRYRELQYQRKESSLWIYDDLEGFVSVSGLYPLVEFDFGKAVPICPYYLYIKDGIRISAAFLKNKELAGDKKELIDDAVKECKNRIPSNCRYIEERHATILMLYIEKHKTVVDRKIFDKFYDFLQVRQNYLDISPCLMIPPIEHDERMECINQAWIEAFEEYIEETK